MVMSFLFYLGNKLSTHHAPLIDAAMEIKLEATTGHLWFEEIMAGDRTEPIEGVWRNIDQADWYANAMLHGDSNDERIYYPLTDPQMRASIISVQQALADFKNIAMKRFNNFSESIPGTDIDQQFDAVFHEFIKVADQVESIIQQQIAKELTQYRWLGGLLVIFSALISFFLSNFLYKREVNRDQLLDSLTAANQSIDEKNKELNYLAHFDHLTGLPNRVLFADRLEQSIAHSNRKQSAFSLLFIDLDNFKAVNDRYGHQQGDRLLKQTSGRLRHCIRDDDSLIRISGDEFIVILYDIHNVDSAISAANSTASKIIEEMRQPFNLDGTIAYITASVGVAIYPTDSTNGEVLTRCADNAMYHAKLLGKNNYQFYSEELNQKALQQLEIERDLRDAINHDQFELHYHPQWKLNSGAICGVEALVRWQHPEHGFLYPNDFIPVAESCGLIQELDVLIITKSLKQYRQWQNKGLDFGNIAINVSSISIQQPDFLSIVVQLLTDIGVQGENIEFEITESILVENCGQSQSLLANLNKLGIRVAIDDFGTGYSSMAYLKDFSIQTLKIDRSFISDYDKNGVSTVILNNMITLGNDLGMSIIAEGIETKEQEDHLKEIGCDIGQGYYLTRPIPAREFEELLITKGSDNILILNPSKNFS
jgi:diguanylate cyclase (GGDEF)-like protein